MRKYLALLIPALLQAPSGSAAAGEAGIAMTGAAFLGRTPADQTDYVAGLSDQILLLHRAGLVEGFRWFESCVVEGGHERLSLALAAFIRAEPARAGEPAARNFLWAAASVCPYSASIL